MADNTDFTLSRDSYTTFDALTLKQLIKKRLNEGGVFTDQAFEGSNISAIIDIISYSYHTLLFYLNNTASESTFNEATLYENMNRIVKLIDYKPTGFQTSILSFEAVSNEKLIPNLYTIKRYSYFTVNGIDYSFTNDVSFSKSSNTSEVLSNLSENNLLYQGKYYEYPEQQAVGEDFETVTLVVKDNITGEPIFIDEKSINVYVRESDNGRYSFYEETNNMFLKGPGDLNYEKRINENGFYEIKFGNGVFGRRLRDGDDIFIYYLKSDGDSGVISPNQLNGNQLNIYSTPTFEDISDDIYDNANLTFLSPQNAQLISFSNLNGSTTPKQREDVDSIRTNSKKIFQSQNRLVTIDDYESFINKNFSNILDDIKVVNNKTYISDFIDYFYKLGLDKPNEDPRFLFNQLKFSSPSDSNNVYIFMVPAISNVDSENNVNFLTTPQKNTIINAINTQKMVNIEIIPQDPIYNAFGIGLREENELLTTEIIDDTYLVAKRSLSNRISVDSIKQQINNIFISYFKDAKLGSIISLTELKNKILSIDGVVELFTRRVSGDKIIETPNLSLLSFNINYPDIDISDITSDLQLPFFKYPFLYNNSILNNIIIEDA
mgnify:CR=1 FL=1|tara:strand:+ start:1198 stop:3012 length:1815 start_codon:yes stop_codon:yes gene_type:complete